MSEAKYPKGSTLICPCGKSGPVLAITGHWGRSKASDCHPEGMDRLRILDAPAMDTPSRDEPSDRPDHPNAAGDILDATDGYDVSEANGAYGETEPENLWQAARDLPDRTTSLPSDGWRPEWKRKNGSNGKAASVSTDSDKLEIREPARRTGIAAHDPQPTMFRCTLELPLKMRAIYDAVQVDEDFEFEGTFSELVASVFFEYFEILGADIRLVRLGPRSRPSVHPSLEMAHHG